MSLWEYSDSLAANQAAKDQNEAAYLETLKEASAVPGAFNKLDES